MCLEITEERRIVRSLRNKFPQLSYSDAKDALHEAYLQFYILPEQKRHQINNSKWWLLKVASRYANTTLKRRNRNTPLENEIHEFELKGNNYVADPYKDQLYNDITESIHQLPLRMRIVLYRHYIEGYSYKEIALMDCRTEESVKKSAQRALMIMRDIILENIR